MTMRSINFAGRGLPRCSPSEPSRRSWNECSPWAHKIRCRCWWNSALWRGTTIAAASRTAPATASATMGLAYARWAELIINWGIIVGIVNAADCSVVRMNDWWGYHLHIARALFPSWAISLLGICRCEFFLLWMNVWASQILCGYIPWSALVVVCVRFRCYGTENNFEVELT